MPTRFYRFVRPSFWDGFARAFDMSGRIDCVGFEGSGDEVDARAVFSDWERVGNDIRQATRDYALGVKK